MVNKNRNIFYITISDSYYYSNSIINYCIYFFSKIKLNFKNSLLLILLLFFINVIIFTFPKTLDFEVLQSKFLQEAILLLFTHVAIAIPFYLYLRKSHHKKVIETSGKRRFELSGDANFVRANQGHSIEVDLGLQARTPPSTLYHGTSTKFIEQIEVEGLKPKARQFVHLSLEYETAKAVGSRHGKPIVLTVDSQKMHEAGYKFFISANGVWLTKTVPSSFLRGF